MRLSSISIIDTNLIINTIVTKCLFFSESDLPMLSPQIDWGDIVSGTVTEEVNFGITVEDGVDWGISLESGAEVKHFLALHFKYHS